jgi:hypothetical protein
MDHDQIIYIYIYIYIYIIYLTIVKWIILKLILAQLPMKKLIKVKSNHI